MLRDAQSRGVKKGRTRLVRRGRAPADGSQGQCGRSQIAVDIQEVVVRFEVVNRPGTGGDLLRDARQRRP